MIVAGRMNRVAFDIGVVVGLRGCRCDSGKPLEKLRSKISHDLVLKIDLPKPRVFEYSQERPIKFEFLGSCLHMRRRFGTDLHSIAAQSCE